MSEHDIDNINKRILKLDLQFFAKDGPGGEKTEEPTSKKLEDSRKEGKVAKSQELGNAVILIAMFSIMKVVCIYLGQGFIETFNVVYSKIADMTVFWDDKTQSMDFCVFIGNIMLRILMLLAPFFAIGVVVGFVINVVQVKWKVTAKPLAPKFSKFNPVSGVKRLFSKEKLFDLVKSIAKVLIIYYVASGMIMERIGMLMSLCDMPLFQAIESTGTLIIDIGMRISFVYLILAFADLFYQKWKFHEDMKMTKQEVKDEMKNQEGNPEVKGQQKRRMREASQRRMMQSIPQADVVITNPTHFAVALKYDSLVAAAPVVVAKGEDYLAQKIKDVARENGVEIVENKALARMIYHNVKIGDMIPQELYQAVAEVLAFVYNLKNNRAS